MSNVFLRAFNVSVAAGWIVLTCLLVRVILRRRLPGWVRCVLWGLVGVRLLFTFSLESILSLIPSAETVPPTITTAPVPQVNVGVPPVDHIVNPVISQTMAPVPEASINPMQVVVSVGAVVWLVGVAVMLLIQLVNTVRFRRMLRVNRPEEKGVYACDGISTAFVVGALCPRIYVPSRLEAEDREYVLAHERMHIRRGDHIGKPLGTLLLAVYWFHPLLWVAYALYCRDVELACDEAVLNQLGEAHVVPYATALVNCVEKQMRAHKPGSAAFGESDIEERVKNMMKYKKPKTWVTLASIALIVVAAVCFLANPVSADEPTDPILPPNGQDTTDATTEVGEDTTESTTPDEPGTEEVETDDFQAGGIEPEQPAVRKFFDHVSSIQSYFNEYRKNNSGKMFVADSMQEYGIDSSIWFLDFITVLQADGESNNVYENPLFYSNVILYNSEIGFHGVTLISPDLTPYEFIGENALSTAVWEIRDDVTPLVIGWYLVYEGVPIFGINFDADISNEDMEFLKQEIVKTIIFLEY